MKSFVSSDKCGENFAQRLAFVSIESSSRDISYQQHNNLFKRLLKTLFSFTPLSERQKSLKILSPFDIRRLLIEENFGYNSGEAIDLNERILQAWIYSSNMYTPRFNPLNWFAYHVLVIFKTSSWWWSIDKNPSCIVIQRSRELEPLFEGKPYPTILHPKKPKEWANPSDDGPSLRELFEELYRSGQIENNYHLRYANCQHFVANIFAAITGNSWEGILEKIGFKKDESYFEEARRLGRTDEIESVSSIDSEVITVASTRFRIDDDGEKLPTSTLVIFRHRNGYTPLVESIFEGYPLEEVKAILEHDNYCPVKEELPLHVATELGRDDVVKYLLEKRHLWTILGLLEALSTVQYGNLTPLYNAVMSGRSSLETIKSVATERNINIADEEERMGPLHWAVRQRTLKTTEYLLQIETIDLNAQNYNGDTPIHWATETMQPDRYFENVIESLKTTENLAIQNEQGMTPLHCAVRSRHEYLVPHLWTNSIISIQNNNGDTPLHTAVYFNRSLDIFELLLSESTIDPNILNCKGHSPLHVAVMKGEVDIARILLQNKNFLKNVDINLDVSGKEIINFVPIAAAVVSLILTALSLHFWTIVNAVWDQIREDKKIEMFTDDQIFNAEGKSAIRIPQRMPVEQLSIQ